MLRGHNHVQVTGMVNVKFGNDYHPVLISVCPPLCGPNEYAVSWITRRGQPFIRVGGTLISLEAGKVTDYKPVYRDRDYRYVSPVRAYNNGNCSQGDGVYG
jgi:hypothetical protein